MPAVSWAAATIAPTLSGFTVGIKRARAGMPSSASLSAAMARQITVPLLMMSRRRRRRTVWRLVPWAGTPNARSAPPRRGRCRVQRTRVRRRARGPHRRSRRRQQRPIYQYFGNKEQFFGEVLTHELGITIDAVQSAAPGSTRSPTTPAGSSTTSAPTRELARLTFWEGLELGEPVANEHRRARSLEKLTGCSPRCQNSAAKRLRFGGLSETGVANCVRPAQRSATACVPHHGRPLLAFVGGAGTSTSRSERPRSRR